MCWNIFLGAGKLKSFYPNEIRNLWHYCKINFLIRQAALKIVEKIKATGKRKVPDLPQRARVLMGRK